MPMSSPQMTRMFGFPPGGADCCTCACVTSTGATAPSAEIAAIVVLPSKTLRRFNPLHSSVFSRSSLPIIALSLCERHVEHRHVSSIMHFKSRAEKHPAVVRVPCCDCASEGSLAIPPDGGDFEMQGKKLFGYIANGRCRRFERLIAR